MHFQPVPGRPARVGHLHRLRERATHAVEGVSALAREQAARPYRALGLLVAGNLAAIALFALIGELVFADPAELFRELMPGTWLSVAQLGVVAVIAWTIHGVERPGERIRFDNLWGMSVAVFILLAVDEATQLTIFVGDALTAAGALAPAGFQDIDAFLLSVVLLAAGAALLRYARALLAHRAGLAILVLAVALGAASQTLDSVLPSSSSEFVAEESLKLTAEAILIGGALVVLAGTLRKRPPDAL